jgi:hypothetical protein
LKGQRVLREKISRGLIMLTIRKILALAVLGIVLALGVAAFTSINKHPDAVSD